MIRSSLTTALRPVFLLAYLLNCSFCKEHDIHHDRSISFLSKIAAAQEYNSRHDTLSVNKLINKLEREITFAPSYDQCKALRFMAEYALQQRRFATAERYINRSQNILFAQERSNEQRIELAKTYLLKGDLLFAQGLFSYAFQYYYKSRSQVPNRVETTAGHAYMAQYNERQGMIAYKQENFTAAVGHYKDVLKELEHTDHKPFTYIYETQGALSNLSSSFLKLSRPDSALHYYGIALNLLHQSSGRFKDRSEFIAMAHGVIVGNMGDAWMMKRRYDLAERCYLEDIGINDRAGRYQQDALMTKLKLARLYMRTKRFGEAGQLLSLAGRSPDLADGESMANFLMTRADHAQATGHFIQALNDLRKRSALRDSIQQARRMLLSANMGGIFELMEVEHEKEVIENRDELKTYATILITVLSLTIAFLLYRNIRSARKRIRESEARNDELRLALTALEASSRENAKLSDLLAHDIRNPVHALSTIITLMQTEERSPEDLELFALANESIQKINLIVEDILHRKDDLNTIRLECRDCDLAALLRHSVALLRFKASEKKQKIQKTSVKVLHLSIDQHKIWRVINNILVNAIKFSPEGATIWVELKEVDDHAVIDIRDEGIGIPADLQDKLFSGSTSVQRMGTGGEESFGMGLHTSRKIIEAHQGSISFQAAERGGTIFTIRLPKGPLRQ